MFLELRRLFHNTKHGAQHNPKWRSNRQYEVCNVMGLGGGTAYVVVISRHLVLAGGTTIGYNYTLLSIITISKGVWGFPPPPTLLFLDHFDIKHPFYTNGRGCGGNPHKWNMQCKGVWGPPTHMLCNLNVLTSTLPPFLGTCRNCDRAVSVKSRATTQAGVN